MQQVQPPETCPQSPVLEKDVSLGQQGASCPVDFSSFPQRPLSSLASDLLAPGQKGLVRTYRVWSWGPRRGEMVEGCPSLSPAGPGWRSWLHVAHAFLQG